MLDFKLNKKIDYSLYLVADRSMLRGGSFEDTILAAIDGGVSVVQLRDKEGESRAFFETALKLKRLLDSRGLPLIINDRADIALAVQAAGVHLGQGDLPCPDARRILGKDAIIGLSVENVGQAKQAQSQGADYLGVGPVFHTLTKTDAGLALGVERVKEVSAAVKIPVVAIGGISTENIALLKGSSLAGVAIVSAIMGALDPRQAAQELKEKFLS